MANRVQRVATGWETQLTIGVDGRDLACRRCSSWSRPSAACATAAGHERSGAADGGDGARPGTRLRLRSEVLAGTWEALVTGQADLAIGVHGQPVQPRRHRAAAAGRAWPSSSASRRTIRWPRVDEPLDDAQLVRHRAVAVADSAQRLTPITVNLLPGQDVLTVPQHARQDRGAAARPGLRLSCPSRWRAPHLRGRPPGAQGHDAAATASARLCYAWRAEHGRAAALGLALQWWLGQLESPTTRRALLERHAGPLD